MQMQYAGGILLQPVQTLVATIILRKQKANESPRVHQIKTPPSPGFAKIRFP